MIKQREYTIIFFYFKWHCDANKDKLKNTKKSVLIF